MIKNENELGEILEVVFNETGLNTDILLERCDAVDEEECVDAVDGEWKVTEQLVVVRNDCDVEQNLADAIEGHKDDLDGATVMDLTITDGTEDGAFGFECSEPCVTFNIVNAEFVPNK